MTTEARERLYLAQHLVEIDGRPIAVFNPKNRPIEELPVIYGFNNGGSPGWFSGQLLAEDGAGLGGHICSHEGYMPHDLGILDGSRPDRHETFQRHYPDGYRMEFVSLADVKSHEGLMAAYKLNQENNDESSRRSEENRGSHHR
jgi:hypothetical protein